ncbi:MAG: thymidylate synthase [Clostridiaceae bacterium]|jgi:thymidylate synthase|nr:thymidylate synthase [Clostridiaceae bacterium]
MSRCDIIFQDNIRDILQNGCSDEGQKIRPRWEDGSPAHTIKRFGIVNRYDLSEEFPIMTLRRVYYRSAVEELLWIWQKKSNKLADLSTGIWDQWMLPDGSIGKAYGYQLAQKHKYKEGMFDQVDRVLYDLKHNPYSRRMIVSMFNHADLSEMALYPCAYSMTFNVTGNKLNAILNQRSNDMLVANHWNVTQYAILLAMIAQVSDLEAGELLHVIADAHIYDRHIPIVKEVIERQAYAAPKLLLDPSVKNFYDFTVDSVSFENYRYGAAVKGIPVAI